MPASISYSLYLTRFWSPIQESPHIIAGRPAIMWGDSCIGDQNLVRYKLYEMEAGMKDETFEGTFPFSPHYYPVGGFEMHYVDEGSGEPLVLLHGDPTWGYLYRKFIPPLSQRCRCIVPDHMGMGKSAVPQERERYRLEQHCANLEALLLSLDVHDITLVLHDWGG